MTEKKKIAIIGSFKQYYREIKAALEFFVSNNISVTSSAGAEIIKPDIPFVLFTSDNPNFSDEMVQTITLKRNFFLI